MPIDFQTTFGDMKVYSPEFMDKLEEVVDALNGVQRHFADIESKLMEPEEESSSSASSDTFMAICLGSNTGPWPRKYEWHEVTLVGVASNNTDLPSVPVEYVLLEGGRTSFSDGTALFATNRNEMIEGFGDVVGPWDQTLESDIAIIVVYQIAVGMYIRITMETSTFFDPEEGKNGENVTRKIPMFSGENPYQIACI